MPQFPSMITRLFSKNRDESFSGAIRIGGTEYNVTWSHARLLSTVYRNPTGYRVIEATAHEFMRPDWAMYDKTGTDRNDNDPFLDILNNPFPLSTGANMRYHISRDLDMNGGTFLVKMRGRDYFGDNGPISGLKRLAPQRLTVVTGDDDELIGFIYIDRAGRRAPILPEELIYIHFPDGEREWHRMPPAAVAGLPADLDNAAMRFNAELLDNDGGLPGYLVVDGLTPTKFAEWVAHWRSNESPGQTRVLSANSGGPGQSGRGNATYVRVGVSNQELQYDRLREMAKEDICLALGYMPVLLNPDGTTFANMDTARRNWIVGHIFPRWVWVRDALNAWLKDDLPTNSKIGFNLEMIDELSENLDATVNRELLILNAQGQTINDFLKKLGRDPVPWGNEEPQKPPSPADMLALANKPDDANPDDPEEDPEDPKKKSRIKVITKSASGESYLKGFHDRVEAKETAAAGLMRAAFLTQGEAIAARIRSKRGKSRRKAVEDWWDGDRWAGTVGQVVDSSSTAMVKSAGDFVLSTFDESKSFETTSDTIRNYLDTQSTRVAGLVNNTTKEDVRGILADMADTDSSVEEMADAVKAYFTDNAEMRSMRFARTEMIGAANFAAKEAARQSGLDLEKGWSAASTADEECADLDGEWIGLDDTFSDGTDAPPVHPNCRCSLIFREKGDTSGDTETDD